MVRPLLRVLGTTAQSQGDSGVPAEGEVAEGDEEQGPAH